MTMKLELSPEVLAGLLEQAQESGLLYAKAQPYNSFADLNGDGNAGDLTDIGAASANLGKANR